MFQFIFGTGFMLLTLGVVGAAFYEESRAPLVPADAKFQIQTVSFNKLQTKQTRHHTFYFVEFETTNGEKQRVALPLNTPCCLLGKRLNELQPGSKIEISWSKDNGIEYLNIEGGEAEISPIKMWDQYRDNWGMRCFLITMWLGIASFMGYGWYKYSLVPYLTLRSSGTVTFPQNS